MSTTGLQDVQIASPRRKWPRYAEYKSTGVEWLGEVPKHWEVSRLRSTLEFARNGIWGTDPDGENDILCVRVADFDRVGFRVGDNIPTTRSVSPSERRGRILNRGDLLLEKSGGGELQPVGAVAMYDSDQPAVCSNFLARLVPSSKCNSRYLSFIHAHLYSARVNLRSIKQTTGIQNLDAYSYFSEKVPLPPLEEQKAIAAFLDRETARIDELIAKKRRLIELLQLKRKALISRAVTKGLDPNAKMKPSGIDWLGDVPEHWNLVRLRFAIDQIEQGWSPQCDSRQAEDHEWGVLKVGCVNGDRFDSTENKALPPEMEPVTKYEIRTGDLLMSRANTRELLGSSAIVAEVRPKLLLCDKLYRIRFDANQVLQEYMLIFFESTIGRFQFEREADGTSGSMKNIGQDTIKNATLALPPIHEQNQMIAKLEDINKQQSHLRESIERAVFKLQSYRSALITAAVTGQIDVRNYRAEVPA